MVDTIAMSANAERVIKPRTFISPKPGLRRRVCVARSSLRLPRAAVKRPRFRRGLVSGAQRRLQITSNGNHAQPVHFIFATIRGSRLFRGATESPSGATAAVPVRHAPSTGCFEFEIWSGARDLNPGPHGPEPAQRCVLPYPGGSLRVLLYSIAELVVSSRVLPCPPASGIA